MALPTPATMGRLLLLLKSVADVSATSSLKKAKKISNFNVGSLVQAEVDAHECLMFSNLIFLYLLLHIVTRSSLKFFCNTLRVIFLFLFIIYQITGIKPLEMRLKFGVHLHGRVHITEVLYQYVIVLFRAHNNCSSYLYIKNMCILCVVFLGRSIMITLWMIHSKISKLGKS